MKIGQLRHKVTIQKLVPLNDEAGQPVETYEDFKTTFAAIEPLSGREFFAAQQVNSDVTTRIRIRYTSGIVPSMIVNLMGMVKVQGMVSPIQPIEYLAFDTRSTFEILYIIDPEFRGRELHLMCKERQ